MNNDRVKNQFAQKGISDALTGLAYKNQFKSFYRQIEFILKHLRSEGIYLYISLSILQQVDLSLKLENK